MRSFWREVRAVLGIWWLIVPGGALGVVAIVQAIRGVHHRTVWFWVALAMTALWLATCVRLRRVIGERNRLDNVLNEEHSRDATVVRIEGFAREFEQLKKEIPSDSTEPGPIPTDEQYWWNVSKDHLGERVKSELRMNAPGLLDYWLTNPKPLPDAYPFVPYAEAFADMSIEQLRHIADQLGAGDDSSGT